MRVQKQAEAFQKLEGRLRKVATNKPYNKQFNKQTNKPTALFLRRWLRLLWLCCLLGVSNGERVEGANGQETTKQ